MFPWRPSAERTPASALLARSPSLSALSRGGNYSTKLLNWLALSVCGEKGVGSVQFYFFQAQLQSKASDSTKFKTFTLGPNPFIKPKLDLHHSAQKVFTKELRWISRCALVRDSSYVFRMFLVFKGLWVEFIQGLGLGLERAVMVWVLEFYGGMEAWF